MKEQLRMSLYSYTDFCIADFGVVQGFSFASVYLKINWLCETSFDSVAVLFKYDANTWTY